MDREEEDRVFLRRYLHHLWSSPFVKEIRLNSHIEVLGVDGNWWVLRSTADYWRFRQEMSELLAERPRYTHHGYP